MALITDAFPFYVCCGHPCGNVLPDSGRMGTMCRDCRPHFYTGKTERGMELRETRQHEVVVMEYLPRRKKPIVTRVPQGRFV
jgi:hypothetical protein